MLGLVVYSIGTWEGFHRRRMLEALARNLRGRGFLLVVEPPLPLLDARHLRDWRPAARAVVRPIERVTENLWLVRPMLARPGRGEHAAYARAIRGALRHISPRPGRVAALIYRPDQAWLLGAAGEDSVVYECYDEYRVDFTGRAIPGVYEAEERLLAASKLVLTTSRPLYESRRMQHANVQYTPNGAEYALFSRAQNPELPVADAVKEMPSPVVGYLGNFTPFLDFAAIEQVMRSSPDKSFVFVGPVSAPEVAKRLRSLPNVRFTGPRPQYELPGHLKGMAATMCLLQMTAYTRCARPLTVMEYLAAGKPTVVRPSPALEDLADVLYLADDPAEISARICEAVQEDCPELVAARQARAREYDWDVLTARTAEIILDSCA